MGIDFQDAANSRTYSGRTADASWRDAAVALTDPVGADVADVGAGGGTYTRAWHELGAATVTAVDSSVPILGAARDGHGDLPGVRFVLGDAAATGLPDGSVDIVFERALVHHVPDLSAVVVEARRVLRPGGVYLVQDRTTDDAFEPGPPCHPRGWFFDVWPRLRAVESARRPDTEKVLAAMAEAGFGELSTRSLWEVRREYPDREDYLSEIRQRTGRSILHELTDDELDHLVEQLRALLPEAPVTERDRWTLWRAVVA